MRWYSQVLGDFGIYLKDYEDFNTYHKKRPVWARFANEELHLMAWQKTKETYAWRFLLAVGVVSFLAWRFISFRLDFSIELTGYVEHGLACVVLLLLLLVSKSYHWKNGFWIGVYADEFEYVPPPVESNRRSLEARAMTNDSTVPYELELDKAERTKRLMYIFVPVCLGALITCGSFEPMSGYDLLVWTLLSFLVWRLGRGLGEESGLREGFLMRGSLVITPSEASRFSLSSADPHSPRF